jgi:phosphatidylserine decarboxylase
MKIHREGFPSIIITLLIWTIINGIIWIGGNTTLLVTTLIITTPILALCIRFFRYPHRETNNTSNILAPADGKVVVIEETDENEYFNDRRLQISIFMSPFNVHVNWVPISGKIKYFRHHNGRFMAAFLPKSSTENERATTVIELENGSEILVKQIAGAMARRIVTYPREGEIKKQGEELGFIKFGSRVDVLLPLGTEVNVELGDKVTGIETIIANI